MKWNYDFVVPHNKTVRFIIHTDCKNEADDQFTVAHALMTQKLDVKGIIGGHFNNCINGRYDDGTTASESVKEVEKILELMHLTGEYPVLKGSEYPLADMKTPIVTDAAKFIIEEAMKEDDRPLFIGMMGAITDLACAILMEPKICERMTCIWIGGGIYPDGGWEFNCMQDVNAANVVFQSAMPVWQVPMNVYKQFTISLAELQLKVKPYGKIGDYLFRQMVELNDKCAPNLNWPHGEIWNLGDEGVIAAIMDEVDQTTLYDMVQAPVIEQETMKYLPNPDGKMIRVYHRMNSRLDLEDLFVKLQLNYPERDS